MKIKVLFFGQLRDIAGGASGQLDVAEAARLEDIFDHFAALYPALRPLRSSIVIAQNQQFAPSTAAVSEGDEIAFLPPVSGGSASAGSSYLRESASPDGSFYALTRRPVDTTPIRARLLAGTDGAVVDFVGVVRNNTKGRPTRYLEYDCYEAMALKVMADIGREIGASYSVGRIAMVHRLGRMEVGETSVAVVVTAPHRKPAFEAALEGINRLKKLVPIWKKEYFEDGEIWVEGEWDESLQRA